MANLRFPSQTTTNTDPAKTDSIILPDKKDTTLEKVLVGRGYKTVGSEAIHDYVTDGTADDVQINSALTAEDVVVITPGTYQITARLDVSKTLILMDGVTLTRGAGMVSDGDDVVRLATDYAQVEGYGAIIDNNSVALTNSSQHAWGVKVVADYCTVRGIRVINNGTDTDAGIGVVGTALQSIYGVRVIDCEVEHTAGDHFFQTQYCGRGTIFQNCRAIGDGGVTVQDGFRTYESSDVKFTNCYAYGTRVGMQSWSSGNRNIEFIGCIAESCVQHGFHIAGTRTQVIGGRSSSNSGRGLNIQDDLAVVRGLVVNNNACTSSYCVTENTSDGFGFSGATDGGEVRIAGDNNTVDVVGEANASTSAWKALIINGNGNHARVQLHNSGPRAYYIGSGSQNNVVEKIINPTAHTITDNGTNTSIIDPSDLANLIGVTSNLQTQINNIADTFDLYVHKGTIDASTNPNYPAGERGHAYVVSVAGKVGGASGQDVEIGDVILCNTDSSSSGDEATVGANWDILQVNLDPSGYLTSSSTYTDWFSGVIETVADGDITLVLKAPVGGTITETTTIAGSGSCTATFKVNTTALGGTANSVTTAEQSQAHASSNTFVAGDDIVLTVSSNSSCADLSFTIKFTRTLS